MASPMIYTKVWSAIVFGEERKKKASVMWKRETEVRMVFAEMMAIFGLCVRFFEVKL